MAVLLPNTRLGIRRRAEPTADALGDLVPGAAGPVAGPWPGRVREGADGRWTLGVDVAAWPVRVHDLVVEPDGRTWVVTSSQLIRHPVDPAVDYVRVEAVEQKPGGSEPGGSEFVGR